MGNCTKQINTGDPIILKDAKGMTRYGMKKNMKGTCNQMVVVDNVELIMFMPNGTDKMYYMDASRFKLDVEALKALEAAHGT